MSGVVIRCQHCGTTQPSIGECEACHEGTTRYFCPNHSPGRWLDGPACDACGARVGVPPAPRTAPPPPRRTSTTAPPMGRRSARPPEPVDEHVWTGPIRTPGRPDAGDPGGMRPPEWRIDPSIGPMVLKAVGVFGCLRRLIILVVILIVLGIIAFFALFGVGGLLYGGVDPGSSQPSFMRSVMRPTFAKSASGLPASTSSDAS
jgi:hypothetical protein